MLTAKSPTHEKGRIPQFSCFLVTMAIGLGSPSILSIKSPGTPKRPFFQRRILPSSSLTARKTSIRCVENPKIILKTCKNCKTQFDPSLNHPKACRFHTAHFGGETQRKFESVYTGGTMNTPDSGRVLQYWHCCGSEDPFDAGCTAAPHCSYDD